MELMGVVNGKNYIVSISVNPKMHQVINNRPKGTRSAFIRRAIFNAHQYDEFVKNDAYRQMLYENQIEALMNMLRYYVNRLHSIQTTGIDLDNFKTWSNSIFNYDYKDPTWTVVFDAIAELTPHIEGLDNAQRAFANMVNLQDIDGYEK